MTEVRGKLAGIARDVALAQLHLAVMACDARARVVCVLADGRSTLLRVELEPDAWDEVCAQLEALDRLDRAAEADGQAGDVGSGDHPVATVD